MNYNETTMKNLFSMKSHARTSGLPGWREALERFPVMMCLFKKIILSLTDGVTKEWCIASFLFWKQCMQMGRRSGWLFVALYLKQSRVALQKFVAGDEKPELSVYVSLTRSGLPRIIPSFHRRKIVRGDMAIVQYYLSLFSVSKLIELAPRVSNQLFKTIVDPSDLDAIQVVASEMRPSLKSIILRYIPGIDRIPVKQGLQFVPTWKTCPSLKWYQKLLRISGNEKNESLMKYSRRTSIFHILPYELVAFQFLMTFCHSRGEQFSQGCLWPPFVRYAFDRNSTWITNESLEWFEKRIGPYLPSSEAMQVPACTGRLGMLLSGDGKRRVFAIGNYINQRLLEPMHQWLATVLKRIPMDGTFNQTAPLDRLSGSSGPVYSVDLKAATDRWPLLLLFELIQCLFDRSFASSLVNSTLGTNTFDVTFVKQRISICFVAGQPLGYYSSWPLFALSHHVLMWWAAEQVYPGKVFRNYAILGDDVVIADKGVHESYRKLVSRLGVSVSVAKTLASPKGVCEFAKKFRVDNLTRDVSPLSVKKLLETLHPMGWYQLMLTLPKPVRLSTKLRLSGIGCRAASRPFNASSHGRKARRLLTLLVHQSDFPIELRLSVYIGRWISPTVVGLLVHFMLDYLEPKDPIMPPNEVFPYPGMEVFNEYSLYQGWMKQYLRYLHWYANLHTLERIDLSDLLDPPVYIRTWFRPTTDENQYRFGIMLKLYDMAAKLARRDKVLCIESFSKSSDSQ